MHLCRVAVVGGPNSKEKPPSWSSPLSAIPHTFTFCPIHPPFHALINNRRAVDDDKEDTVLAGQNDNIQVEI